MNNRLGHLISRISTGATAFICAGFLVHSILSDNGGTASSQSDWLNAQENSLAVSRYDSGVANSISDQNNSSELDQVLTGGITPIINLDQTAAPSAKPVRRELSVLALIRENSDVSPSVSLGTDRVSITVKKGDTLFSIARKHGLRVTELAGLNGLSEPYVIKLGQTLYVAR